LKAERLAAFRLGKSTEVAFYEARVGKALFRMGASGNDIAATKRGYTDT